MGASREHPGPLTNKTIPPITPLRGHKSQLNECHTPSAKLGHQRPKSCPKPKRPTIPQLDLTSLLHSYPYTTHKFTIFQPTQQRHSTYEHHTQHSCHCHEYYCPTH